MEIVQEIINSYVPGEVLNLNNMYLYELPLLPDTVTSLDISNNYIESIDKLPSNLTALSASNNKINSITLPDKISFVDLTYNNLSSINIPDSVKKISIAYNDFTDTPAIPESIMYFDISYNKISELRNLPCSLKGFSCMYNQIEKLPSIPAMLEYFDCSGNKLKDLPELPNSLLQLICSNNQIKNIEMIPNHLTVLDCEGNQLDKLPNFNKDIKFINYENNPIAEPVKLPIKFKLFKLKTNKNIPTDERDYDHLEILPDCFDYVIQKDVRSSAFMSNPNNILIKLYGAMYGISRDKLLEYSNERSKVYKDIENSNIMYVKIIMDKFVSLLDFEKFCNPSYSIYILSKTMDFGHFQNTVKFETRYEEKFAIHPYSLDDYIQSEF